MSYLRAVFYLVVVAVALTTVACDEEEDFSVGESEVTVEAESGTMEFRLRRQNVTEQSQPVRIRVAHVVQLDVDGKEVTNCNDEPIAAETRQTTAAPMGGMFRRKRDVQPVVTGQTIHKQPRGGMRHPQPSNGGAVTQGSVDPDGIGHVGTDGSPPVNGGRRNVGPGGKPSMSGPEAPGRGNHPSTDGSGLGGVRFSNFARANFTVERKRVHQAMKHGRRGLKALQKRFHANLGEGVGKMAIDMSLPEDDGEIEIDGEKQKLKKGDLKFNIELSEWSWCGEEGDNGTGAFLDVYVEINSTRRPTMRRQRTASAPASFDLGDNTTMSFSGKYQRDGVWKDVDSGYPKVDRNLIIVRFPRFNSKLFYDPTVSVESEDDVTDDNNSNGGGKGGISDSNCLSVSAMFVTMTTALTYILLK